MKQFLSFVRKEFHHIFRDKRTMLILLVMPIILLLLFGYAINTEMKGTRVGILDLSKDEITRQIHERFDANAYFTVTKSFVRQEQIDEAFRSGQIDLVLIFEANFGKNLLHTGKASVQLLTDGSEPNQASMRTGYATQILQSYQQAMLEEHGIRHSMQIVPETRMLYNPQQISAYNFVPGIIGVILMLICAMMSSIAIVREKEMGTMEVLLASPLPPLYIILAKLVPYFVLSCTNIITILLLAVFLLGIPIAGSLVCFIGVTFIYILVALSLGLLISTLVSTQLAAMLLSLLLIVPTVYLSSLAFPIESMPVPMQKVSAIVPARWYIEVARKLLIQGVDVRFILKESVILFIQGMVLIGISWKMFKTRLE